MVTALKILVNRGMPLTLVKTGHNDFPDLLQKWREAEAGSGSSASCRGSACPSSTSWRTC